MFHHVSTFTQLGEINTHRFCTWKTRFNITFFARQLWLVLLLKIHGKNEHEKKTVFKGFFFSSHLLSLVLLNFVSFHQASVQRLALHRQRIYRIHTSAVQQRNHQHLKPRTTRLAVECPTMYDKCLYIFVRNVGWPCAVSSIQTYTDHVVKDFFHQ